ncbi:MAG: succinate dehydrogenase iron-sulfur subunit [Nitrospirae bacterium]|nr:succinate dehydrogenase iron-sulfur subunit [Nitrospirota bacterium]
MGGGSATFKIFRHDPSAEGEEPRFQEYEVPVRPGLTVLDALFYVQERLDSSLAFRASCRAAACGSCAMHIAGGYGLACQTQVEPLGGGPIVLRPLAHLPIIRDLVVDMGPFWEKYNKIRPFLVPGEPAPEKERTQSPDDRDKLEGLIDCILCGICSSACAVGGTDDAYLGPAALLNADRFVQDTRDGATEERLRIVDGEHGVWRCHTIFSCQEACPKGLDPTGAIMTLRRTIIRHRWKKLVR